MKKIYLFTICLLLLGSVLVAGSNGFFKDFPEKGKDWFGYVSSYEGFGDVLFFKTNERTKDPVLYVNNYRHDLLSVEVKAGSKVLDGTVLFKKVAEPVKVDGVNVLFAYELLSHKDDLVDFQLRFKVKDDYGVNPERLLFIHVKNNGEVVFLPHTRQEWRSKDAYFFAQLNDGGLIIVGEKI